MVLHGSLERKEEVAKHQKEGKVKEMKLKNNSFSF
jgi:hypothetical protein